MKAIKKIQGIAIPMNMTDIDTDIIIPAQYLTSTSQSGYGQYAFARLKSDAGFVLNQEKYKAAPILITGANFGCGSSREHAVWAIKELGIQAIIAPSFADIFANNAKKNGLVLIEQSQEVIDDLLTKAENNELNLTIDIENLSIIGNDNHLEFTLNPFFKHCLINGLDELDYLMSNIATIKEFKNQQINTTLFINH
jgi:3-isopropylmalate/(R)-2-methylmalate dehydratase small subunit